MCSNASASASAPEPFAIARSMLSFGIEYDFAFSIAFCSARLFAGSPPPFFAATMIAFESFEKSCPRLASAAPFLCLIEDHLLCPDTGQMVAAKGPAAPRRGSAAEEAGDLVSVGPGARLARLVADARPPLGEPQPR